MIAIVALSKGSWPLIKRKLPEIAAAVAAATPGSYADVEIPFDRDLGDGWPSQRLSFDPFSPSTDDAIVLEQGCAG